MTLPSLLIRPPLSPQELAEHIQANVEVAQAFSPDPLPPDTAARMLSKLTTAPGYRQEQVRSAYRAGAQLGGYKIYERLLRVGAARLATGCIGGVYTRPEARNQGVARAMMQDAITYAAEHQYALLLLDGIPRFYGRYGYCDVYDLTAQELDMQAILALPESPYPVRSASVDDARDVLALYERQFGPYTGSFARSIEQQRHWLQHLEPEKFLVAQGSAGEVRGYLYLAATQARGSYFLAGTQLWELVVADWPAAVALLQFHARAAAKHTGEDAAQAVLYSAPPTSPLADWLTEHLEVVDISTWDAPVLGWAVREHTFRHRNAAWMARLVSLSALTHAMLSEWQGRWLRSLARWSGDISLVIGEEAFTLRVRDTDLRLLDRLSSSISTFALTSQNFVQIIFGYRDIVRVLQQRGHTLPDDLATALTILFPTGQAWIPASDWF